MTELETYVILADMQRALRDVVDLDNAQKRAAAYVAAGIDPKHIHAHDESALRTERTFRVLFGKDAA